MSRSSDDSVSTRNQRVGLIFDERMYKHYAPHEKDHVECPDRIRVIWDLLNSSGLAKRCIILKAKAAEDNHLALVHTKNHITLIKNISSKNTKSKRKRIAEKFDSIYFNEGSTEAACLAAGSVIEAAEKVAKGEIDSAFAIVRPPGHHAEEGEPMGFCLYNNVAIAASYLLNERQELGINKILIVDWDVHHGNGTQKMFYKDPRVLVFSVHRHDFGTFYPTGDDGSYIMTGEGAGAGHNINVPWEHGKCGDADYLAVWDHILIPITKEFEPDMIIISAGFDAAKGDPLGGCCVSPNGYSIMLHKLMKFAGGKIVMSLEGGYNLNSTACSVRACVEVLLHEKSPNVVLAANPFDSTWSVILDVGRVLRPYWACDLLDLDKLWTFMGSSDDQDLIDFNEFSTVLGSEQNLPALAQEKKTTTLEQLGSLMPEPSIAKKTSTLSLAEPSDTEPLCKRLKSKASTTKRVLTYSPEISSPFKQISAPHSSDNPLSVVPIQQTLPETVVHVEEDDEA
ncbi:histone deacetylase 5-like [Salvia miltiorrhiza]|uniref:histone deacetylase 5-like n=1 Tax=Salvia miltiorrhiza TaxID=226208 RepID=UPI0025AD08AD|nr:histone deacetylase 5-like [Salvia miltiorrhiza]